jgi:hypothetical protein
MALLGRLLCLGLALLPSPTGAPDSPRASEASLPTHDRAVPLREIAVNLPGRTSPAIFAPPALDESLLEYAVDFCAAARVAPEEYCEANLLRTLIMAPESRAYDAERWRAYRARLASLGASPRRRRLAILQTGPRHTELLRPLLQLFARPRGGRPELGAEAARGSPRGDAWAVDLFLGDAHPWSFADWAVALEGPAGAGGRVRVRPSRTFEDAFLGPNRHDLAILTTGDEVFGLSPRARRAVLERGVLVAHAIDGYLRLRPHALLTVALTPLVFPLREAGADGDRFRGGPILPVHLDPAMRARASRGAEWAARCAAGHAARARPAGAGPAGVRARPTALLVVVGWGSVGKDDAGLRAILERIRDDGLSLAVALVSKGRGPAPGLRARLSAHVAAGRLLWLEAVSAAALSTLLECARFVLTLIAPWSGYKSLRMTGAVPAALSAGVPLVVDAATASTYGLERAAVVYETSLLEALPRLVAILDPADAAAAAEYRRLETATAARALAAFAENRRLLV